MRGPPRRFGRLWPVVRTSAAIASAQKPTTKIPITSTPEWVLPWAGPWSIALGHVLFDALVTELAAWSERTDSPEN